jgi:hypothetical protein
MRQTVTLPSLNVKQKNFAIIRNGFIEAAVPEERIGQDEMGMMHHGHMLKCGPRS